MCLLCFFDQQTNILSLFCVFSRFFWCFLVLLTSSFFLPHLSFICLRLFFSHCRVIWWVSVIPAVVGSRSHCPAAFPCSCLVCLFHPCFLVPVVFSWSCLCPLINYIHWYFCVSSCTHLLPPSPLSSWETLWNWRSGWAPSKCLSIQRIVE